MKYLHEDFMFGGEYNLCSLDTIEGFIDQYFRDNAVKIPCRINEDDVRLYFRNKRYELMFEAQKAEGYELEAWLDGRFGKKGGTGGNKKRSEARRFFTKHKPGAMKRIYKENENINILMNKVENMSKEEM